MRALLREKTWKDPTVIKVESHACQAKPSASALGNARGIAATRDKIQGLVALALVADRERRSASQAEHANHHVVGLMDVMKTERLPCDAVQALHSASPQDSARNPVGTTMVPKTSGIQDQELPPAHQVPSSASQPEDAPAIA